MRCHVAGLAWVLVAAGVSPLTSQAHVQPTRYLVRVRDAVDTGVVEQRVRRLGHDARNLTRNIVLVTERPTGRRGVRDSLMQLRRDRRAGARETMDIEKDVLMRLDVPGTPQANPSAFNLFLIHADAAWAAGFRGQGQRVGDMDTGFGPGVTDVTIGRGKNFGQGDSTNYDDDIADCRGHGTHTAGTIAGHEWGVAPDAELWVAKVFMNVGFCGAYTSTQIAALQWFQANNVWVVNVSIGGNGPSAIYEQAIADYTAAGGLFCAAAGNAGATPPENPANAPAAIAVASVGSGLARSSFSNYGAKLELSAPGEGITSDAPGGGTAAKSGTSMATPHCTGGYTLLRSAGITGDSARQLMNATADPLGDSTFTGHGLLRPDKAIAASRGGVLLAGSTIRDYAAPRLDSIRVVATAPYTVTSSWSSVFPRGDYLVFTATRADTVTVRPVTVATGPVVMIDPNTRYQTMTGWEATAQIGQTSPGFAAWQAAVLDSAVALGITRLRVELHSGAENPVDAYAQYRAGTLTSAQWNAARYAWVNDNASPTVLNPAGFQWAKIDESMTQVVLPLRDRLAARGESLYLSMNYVSFGNSTAHADPAEWAELIVAAFQHLQSRFGVVPDAVEVILEPDNNAGTWYGTAIGRAIAAAGPRLAALGFRPDFVAPSVTNMANTVPYLDAIVAVPGALTYLTEVSYHRYAGVSDATLAGIAARATALGLRTAMLEHIGSGVDDLLADVTRGRASAWQQYTLAFPTADNGAQYFPISGNTVTVGALTRQLAPVFQAVRRGAVRIGSTSSDQVTAAFVNPDGRVVVVLRPRAAGATTLIGLPAGQYTVTFIPDSGPRLTSTTTTTGNLPVAFPASGVLVVRGIP